MLQFFNNNRPQGYIGLLLAGLLLFLPTVLGHQYVELPEKQMVLYELFVQILSPFSHLSLAFAFLLMAGEAVIFGLLVENQEIRTKNTHLPTLFFLVFATVFPAFRLLQPVAFGGMFLLLSLHFTLNTYRKEKAFSDVFNAGLMISFGSMFYLPLLLLFLIVWIGISILRPFNWREWAISFIGLILPYLYLLTGYFLSDKLASQLHFMFMEGYTKLGWKFSFEMSYIPFLIIFGFILLMAAVVHLQLMVSGKVKTQKNSVIMLWLMVLILLSSLVSGNWSMNHLSLLAIPLGVLFSNYFSQIKSRFWSEILFILLIAGIVIGQFVVLK